MTNPVDPMSEMVALLQPSVSFSKLVGGAGRWRVRRGDADHPFYCAILDGSVRLALDGQETVLLRQGDFILAPAARGFAISSIEAPAEDDIDTVPVLMASGEFRNGPLDEPADVHFVVGHCVFGSPDAALLVSLLPQVIVVRGEERLAVLVKLLGDESRARHPARETILEHLLEVLLIEALRFSAGAPASTGLMCGLADVRIAQAIRCMHQDPAAAWTVASLAQQAALSRSAFFERFKRTVGVAPMEYLLTWRMALAKKLLRQQSTAVAEIAQRVGYSSASTFSVAFARHVGVPPARFGRQPLSSTSA